MVDIEFNTPKGFRVGARFGAFVGILTAFLVGVNISPSLIASRFSTSIREGLEREVAP